MEMTLIPPSSLHSASGISRTANMSETGFGRITAERYWFGQGANTYGFRAYIIPPGVAGTISRRHQTPHAEITASVPGMRCGHLKTLIHACIWVR